jgi:NAD(P)-dependent dehydrogenase (short-subunit alcohol dehydrogenase family)
LRDRTALVTGASSGVGLATARALGRLGATVVLACRDRKRGEEAAASVRRHAGHDNVHLLLADLSSQASVRRLADEFLATGWPLHVLVNNAGIINLRHARTVDGIESVFAVNHLAYFMLTNLLLERLQASAPARIVNVASEAHRLGRMDFADLEGERRFKPMRIYGRSKLANILFTYELARRLDGAPVTANCLHPGTVGTRIGHNNGRIARLLTGVVRPFFRTPEEGAETSVHLASSAAVEGVTGRYFRDRRAIRSSAQSYDRALATRLWEVSAKMTGLD